MKKKLPHLILNDKPDKTRIYLNGTVENKTGEGDGPARVAIQVYSGNAVNLSDYGIDVPVVYNMQGITVKKETVPYLLNHNQNDVLGAVTKFNLSSAGIRAEATHSYPSSQSKEVGDAIKNGVPYEASMGYIPDFDSVVLHEKGTVQVNGKTFQAPLLVVNKGQIVEVSATLFGRDSETSVNSLSQEDLMIIKNAAGAEDTDPKPEQTENPPAPNQQDPAPTQPEPTEDPKPEPILNNNPPTLPNNQPANGGGVKQALRIHKLMKMAGGDEKLEEIVLNGLEAEQDDLQIQNAVKLHKLENGYPTLPGLPPRESEGQADAHFLARMAMSVGLKPEFIENKLGKKVTGQAFDEGPMDLKESMMICANSNGGRFTGHSDVRAMTKHMKRLHINNAYSTIDYPNLMHKVSDWMMESHWEIAEPWAPSRCKAVSNKDFRKTGHLRPQGGQMWNGLNQEGKIEHGSFGEEHTYETQLNTVAQILTFKREDIENDDMGWIQETLEMMIEGALMVPDYQMVNLIYNGNSAGVIPTANYHTLALTRANLSTVYKAVRKRNITKGEKTVNGLWNTRWRLVVSPDLEETAWDILKQDRIIPRGSSDDRLGDKNYWFNRLDLDTFPQMDNTSYNSSATASSWMIMPVEARLSPFAISYLRGRTRPITEVVDLPADELGFGVRGYWDVNLDYRNVKDDKTQAWALSVV